MRYLRQNTATIVSVGPFYDKTDGVTIETGLTISNERISFVVDNNDGSAPTLVLDNVTGATSGTDNDLNYISGCDAGMMQLELTAANTNYVGRGLLSVTDAANHCPVFHEFMLIPGAVFDSIIAGTDKLAVDAQEISSDSTAADNLEAMYDGTGYAGGSTKLKVDLETIKTQSVTCAAGVTVLASVGTAATSTAQTGDAYARLGAPAGASVSADVAAVKSDSAAILLDTGTDGVVVATASKTGYALSAAGIQAIWDALSSALTTVGSIGKRIVDYLDAAVSGRAAATTALDNTVWTNTKAGYLDAAVSSRSTLAAGAQMDLVNAPNATAITAIQNGLATASALTTVDGIVDSILAAVDTEVAAIKAKTDNLPSDPADQSAVEAAITAATSPLATSSALAIVDALVDAIKAKTDLIPAAPASVGDIPTVTDIHQHQIDGTQFRLLIARMAALLVGKSSGEGYVFRDVADARDAVTFVADANNNRTSVTYNDTGA